MHLHYLVRVSLSSAAVFIIGCTEPSTGIDDTWRIDSVTSDSGGTPVGILALGTEVSVGDEGVQFTLGGASLSRDAEVTRTETGARIEFEMKDGRTVALEFEQLDDPEHAELRWTASGKNVVAMMSRGGAK
jgi:hypothetical protein